MFSQYSHSDGTHSLQTLAGLHNKTRPKLLLKTSPVKLCPGGKYFFVGRGPSGKIHIPGAKNHVIGVALTHGHEKTPWQQCKSSPILREDLATPSIGEQVM